MTREPSPLPRAALALGGVLLLACALLSAPARAQQSLEYPVKANYLVKFAAFVDWPQGVFASPASPVTICIVGRDPFGEAIDRAAAQGSPSGRPVNVRRLDRLESNPGCHIAYLGAARGQATDKSLAAVSRAPVLTVTDSARAGPRGVIHFAISGNRVRFHIDDLAAQQRGLTISSRLLSLALSVRPRRQA